ncbi:sodium-coupled monocarboxylate transporter 1 [Anabrus simplex]|uniref:sodium-coupled monocarboxylate transporter 1 n=1 Tax=Anabrus simplex TaxID=316456 RepID=UPI0035A26D8C
MTLSGQEELQLALRRFSVYDYVVFVLMLLVCIVIGIYYGFFSGHMTTEDYLMGGRNMKLFPTTMSLTATLLTSTALIGFATDVYLNGIQFLYMTFGFTLAAICLVYAFLPVMHGLQLTSIYEYLEMRFDKRSRIFGSVLFSLKMLMLLPTYTYLPAITFSQVTGINVYVVSLLVCLVCIFYTCVGGLKAVVWTDVVQGFSMFGAVILVVIKSTIDIGGIGVVWQRNMDGDRIEPPIFDPDPTLRYSFWSLTIGMFGIMLQMAVFNQNIMQRYMSLPRLRTAKIAAWLSALGYLTFTCFSCYCGLVTYAVYYDCDPITSKLVEAKDQVIPLLVMRTLGNFPGLPGIFVAGVFSAALSTLSSTLNSMSAVVLEDFYKAFSSKPLTERQTNVLMKSVVVIVGMMGFALVFVIEKLGSVLQVVLTVGVMADGPLVGIFCMGFLLPWVNSKGMLAGGIAGIIVVAWASLGAYIAIVAGRVNFPTKPFTVEGCAYNVTSQNMTIASPPPDGSDVFILYRISYMWYVPLGCFVSVVVGLIVSFLTGATKLDTVNHALISPLIRRFLPKQKIEISKHETVPLTDYKHMELAFQKDTGCEDSEVYSHQ